MNKLSILLSIPRILNLTLTQFYTTIAGEKGWLRMLDNLSKHSSPVWCSTRTSVALNVRLIPYTKDIQSSIHQSVSSGG
jgi:hypothetical protein